VVGHRSLDNITDIYNETPERAACQLGRLVDTPSAQAVFLSGTGMPTSRATPPTGAVPKTEPSHAIAPLTLLKNVKKQLPVNRGE
jgi:hypothetical protein